MMLLLCFTPVLSAMTKAEDIQNFTLKNGMKFFVLEDHSIPNANMYLFFKVGSRNEYPGITGLSHFFEHMMFNGAKKYGPKMFDNIMEAAGGANNAYTSEDITAYTDWFPSSSMETIFDLEGDRLANLALEEKMVESERGVIHSEYTTGYENSNFRLLLDELRAVAFTAHPYRWSVIGYESDILNWQRSDLKRYFDIYYAPNNAIAVMVGDVTLEKVKALAEKYFEPIPAREAPRPVHTVEPEQRGEKRVNVNKDVTSPNIMIAYHIPSSQSEEFVALDILSSILSDGKSSRIYSTLVNDKQLAVRAGAFMGESIDPSLFTFFAICAKDVPVETLENAIYDEINKIITDGVTDSELQKVKNRKLFNFYRGMETINGKADNIGTYEIFYGDYKKLFEAPEAYKKVTKENIKAIAAKYFKKSNRTVGIMQKTEEK